MSKKIDKEEILLKALMARYDADAKKEKDLQNKRIVEDFVKILVLLNQYYVPNHKCLPFDVMSMLTKFLHNNEKHLKHGLNFFQNECFNGNVNVTFSAFQCMTLDTDEGLQLWIHFSNLKASPEKTEK